MKNLPNRTKIDGFTLVELLVSIALVLVLMLVVTQIMRGTQMATSASKKNLDADDEARQVFDRVALDLSRRVNRTDVDFQINKQANNDSIYFYSEAPSQTNSGATSTNTVALIGYQVNTNSFSLDRFSSGLGYGASGVTNNLVFLTYASNPVTTANTSLNAQSTIAGAFSTLLSDSNNYQTLAPDVFRFEISFLLKPWTNSAGTLSNAVYATVPYNLATNYLAVMGRSTNTASNPLPPMVSSNSYSNWGEIGWGDVQAIVVTIAVLNPTTRKLLINEQTQIGDMAAALHDAADAALSSNPPILPAQDWQNQIDAGNWVTGVPKPVSEQVRVYQRIFPLN